MNFMKLLRYAAFAMMLMPASAYAQCSGVFPSGYTCGNPDASSATGRGVPFINLFTRSFGTPANSILATNGGGTPALTTTLPSGIAVPAASLTGIVATANGGFGADVSAASGVPLFTAGVPTFTATTGTGNFARAISPALTGTPTAPTAPPSTNTTQIATTAFVQAAPTWFDTAFCNTVGYFLARTTGTWVCSKSIPAYAQWWGVKCDGSTPDQTAASAAGTAVQAAGGGRVLMPQGSCIIGGNTSVVVPTNVQLECAAIGSTTLLVGSYPTVNVIDYGTGGDRQAFRNCTLDGGDFFNVNLVTNLATTTGGGTPTILHFAAGIPSTIVVGSRVYDRTTFASIPTSPFATVSSINSGAGTITMNVPVVGTVASGDSIGFITPALMISFNQSTNIAVENVHIAHGCCFLGLVTQGVQGFKLRDLTFDKTASSIDPDRRIPWAGWLGTATSPGNNNGTADNLTCNYCGMGNEGHDNQYSKLHVPGSGPGSSLVFGPSQFTYNITLTDSDVCCSISTFTNADGLYGSGIEWWAYNSIMSNVIVHDSANSGVGVGGTLNIISNVLSYDNNRAAVGATGAGFTCVYAGADPWTSGTSNFFNGNKSSGASQSYALQVDANCTNTTLGANDFHSGSSGIISGNVSSTDTFNSPAASVSSCGGSPSVNGNTRRGQVTVGSGSPASCFVAFNQTPPSTVFCTANSVGSSTALGVFPAANGVTISVDTGSLPGFFDYHCSY